MIWRSSPIFVLLVIGVVAGAASLLLLMNSLQKELENQRRVSREDIVWYSGQIEREARVFRHALALHLQSDSAANRARVQQTFDIFWSRADSMHKGTMGKVYLKLDGAKEVLVETRQLLIEADPIVTGLASRKKDDITAILQRVDSLIGKLYRVANQASKYALITQESRRKSFEMTHSRALHLMLAVFGAGALLLALFVNRQRALDRLASNLEGTVASRTEALYHVNQQLRMLSVAVEQSPASVVICNREGLIEYVNPKFEEVSGYSASEIRGKNPNFLRSGMTPLKVYEEMWHEITSGREWRGELCNQRKNGEKYWEQVSVSPLFNEEDEIVHYLAVKEDITQRKHYEEQLLKQANYDSLTGLPNRVLALDRLEQEIRHARRNKGMAGLLYVDLDSFKQVNDSLGHEVGDQLLRLSAERLSACLRDCDTAARFGGDEFIVILSEINGPEDAQIIMQRMVETFKQAFMLKGREIFTTVSIGASLYPADGDRPIVLLKNADAAMYQAKADGKNGYRFFVEAMNRQAEERARIENYLHGALQRREFEVYYQPMIDTETGLIVGSEALLRWFSPALGVVPPTVFIPLAEEKGTIISIGEWVLQQACLDTQHWREEFSADLTVAVNASSRQFREPGFAITVLRSLEQAELEASSVKLEITESLLIDDEVQARINMEKLAAQGVRICIDDFGTGYSSLSYLRKFPIDTLKIDRAFLKNVTSDTGEAALACAIMALGRSLGMTLVGEGIETEAQYQFILNNECHLFQGYYVSPPVSAEEFRDLLKQQYLQHRSFCHRR